MVLAVLPEPVVQYDVFDRAGRFVDRLDLANPWAELGIEYDGDHHRGRATFRHEVLRNPDRMPAQIRIALKRWNASAVIRLG
jgi:hypothetical protein